MKILVAVDGSPYTEHTLALTEEKKWRGRNYFYTALYVVPPMPMRAQSVMSEEAVEQYYKDEAEQVFAPIKQFVKNHPMRMKFLYKEGKAAEVIAQTAVEGGFDIILMGTQGENRLTNMVMGSVVTGVLARCEIPVLLLH